MMELHIFHDCTFYLWNFAWPWPTWPCISKRYSDLTIDYGEYFKLTVDFYFDHSRSSEYILLWSATPLPRVISVSMHYSHTLLMSHIVKAYCFLCKLLTITATKPQCWASLPWDAPRNNWCSGALHNLCHVKLNNLLQCHNNLFVLNTAHPSLSTNRMLMTFWRLHVSFFNVHVCT